MSGIRRFLANVARLTIALVVAGAMLEFVIPTNWQSDTLSLLGINDSTQTSLANGVAIGSFNLLGVDTTPDQIDDNLFQPNSTTWDRAWNDQQQRSSGNCLILDSFELNTTLNTSGQWGQHYDAGTATCTYTNGHNKVEIASFPGDQQLADHDYESFSGDNDLFSQESFTDPLLITDRTPATASRASLLIQHWDGRGQNTYNLVYETDVNDIPYTLELTITIPSPARLIVNSVYTLADISIANVPLID